MHGCLFPRHDIAQSVPERMSYPGPEASGGASGVFARRHLYIGGSSSGRTADSDSVNRGSNPRPPATHDSPRRRESVRTLISSKPARRHVWRCSAGRPGPGSREVCVPQISPCCRSVTKPGIEPRFVGDRRTVPGLRFQNLPLPAGRAPSLILPWPSIGRCVRAMSAVWHHRRQSDCDTPLPGAG